jgi:hypothetical protein
MSLSNILGFVGLAATTIGVVGTYFKSEERSEALDGVAESRRKANEVEQLKQNLRDRRERISTVREARIKRATAVSRATAQNAQGSVRGAFGSLVSQGSSQIGFLNQFSNMTGQQTEYLRQASVFGLQARYAGEEANIFSGVGSIGATIFDKREKIAGFLT